MFSYHTINTEQCQSSFRHPGHSPPRKFLPAEHFLTPFLRFDKNLFMGVETAKPKCYNVARIRKCDKIVTNRLNDDAVQKERRSSFEKADKKIWACMDAVLCIHLYPWFARLQENINKPYHVMHTALDDMIPFEEIFIVPYLMWFLYVAATIAFFFFRNRDGYYRLCTFLFTGMTISLLVCTLFPNGTDFRPAIDPDKNIFCYLVSRLWSIDPCINVFPSIHVYNSVGVHIAVCHSEELKKHPMIIGHPAF